MNLQEGNTTQIETAKSKTNPIIINRGVLQGSPLSPTLYNISTNHILDEISEETISKYYGYSLLPNQPNINITSFADDTVIIGKNIDPALQLSRMAINRFEEIGLEINISKSVALTIINGKLSAQNLVLRPGYEIKALNIGDKIRYLGVNFSDQLIFYSNQTLNHLRDKTETFVSSSLLQANQKFTVLNSSISPALIYPFQTIPFQKIPKKFLSDCDKILKSSLKEILQIPIDVPDHMLYSDRKYKGLGLFCASWEARLQRINICNVLTKDGNPFILKLQNFPDECSSCMKDLGIKLETHNTNPNTNLPDARKVRRQLREKEVMLWSQLPHKGKGVQLFKDYTPANKWISDHRGLSCSEWRDAIKMTANVCSVRSLPGRSQDGTLCRRCRREHETLAHVLGSCPYGEVLRNSRHHAVRGRIAQAMRHCGYTVFEEVPGIASNGSNRRIDIIAFKPTESHGLILDPTVRFETHEGQPEEVDTEKRSIYEPTVSYYKDKYKLENIHVVGLMVGARGTIPKFLVQFWTSRGLQKSHLLDIAIVALKGSLAILRNHLFVNK